MKRLTIFINDLAVYEYDRDTALDEWQQAFLEKMDSDMGRGFTIQGELIAHPDSQQRARFVVMNLIKALQQENEAAISVSCAYLSTRLPGLVEVHANDHEGTVKIELLEE
ncbi:hypothetical protein [Sulfuriflexus mobilis]|uniref:hypothetical protein n=1 Tax=Sulfuriflexus mobilis TaxID=1811807 RepID=UPI000F848D76|nr:hypothetical protein [Sulfuriflexus mobilis]